VAQSIDSERVLRFRAVAGHLHHRLSAASLAEAATAGLQDTVPRSALLSLHARVEGVIPTSWEDPTLAQVWGPRGAVYLVPRADVHVFTLGRLPRNPDAARSLEQLAAQVLAVVGEEMVSHRQVQARVPVDRAVELRWSAVAGTIGIRWDCRNTYVYRLPAPTIDVEDARRELARRFLSVLGPATVELFARWAGVMREDAEATLAGMSEELVDIGGRLLLARDLDRWNTTATVEGVRLLPAGDAYLYADRPMLAANEAQWNQLFRTKGSIPGAILADGKIVGTWQRQQGKVTLEPWQALDDEQRHAAEREAMSFPLDVGTITVQWSDHLSL
jgi:hypothetical protein